MADAQGKTGEKLIHGLHQPSPSVVPCPGSFGPARPRAVATTGNIISTAGCKAKGQLNWDPRSGFPMAFELSTRYWYVTASVLGPSCCAEYRCRQVGLYICTMIDTKVGT